MRRVRWIGKSRYIGCSAKSRQDNTGSRHAPSIDREEEGEPTWILSCTAPLYSTFYCTAWKVKLKPPFSPFLRLFQPNATEWQDSLRVSQKIYSTYSIAVAAESSPCNSHNARRTTQQPGFSRQEMKSDFSLKKICHSPFLGLKVNCCTMCPTVHGVN